MGLDAHVYCDCFERGTLNSPPPAGTAVRIDEDGGLQCGSDDLETQIAFDCWQIDEACLHENMHLCHHRLGNISTVAALRAFISQWPTRFPTLLGRVIYSGAHAGDRLTVEVILVLAAELEDLGTLHSSDSDDLAMLRNFEQQMTELVAASRRVNKPIVF